MKDKSKIKAKSINAGAELSQQIAELDPMVQQMCSDLQDGNSQIHDLVNTLKDEISSIWKILLPSTMKHLTAAATRKDCLAHSLIP